MSLPGIEMNGIHLNGKNYNFEKSYPGCLGRMVNLFEVNLGVSANRLLTDKPHRDGSPISRSRSDVSTSPCLAQIEEELIVPDFKNTFSNKKSKGTPMKTLIAQEMSKDMISRQSSPNLVAKLMGLDSLPQQEPDSVMQRSHCRIHPHSQSDIPLSYWEQQNGYFHYVEPDTYKDVHEIRQQSQKAPHKGRYNENTNNKKMDLVRQKFEEAKRLSMDGKLRQSKQFHDALDVLNSNKDLFIKCLQEPKKMFSEHLYNLQSIHPPSETKRITVFRPSKISDNGNGAGAGNKDEKQILRITSLQRNGSEKIWKNYENATQPTRIIVLKPSPQNPQSESPRVLRDEEFFGDIEDDENNESQEVAKAVTQKMREKLGRHHRDETLVSSVFSNGYIGDASSFNKSEIDYETSHLSDSEVISPVSRHSWDYINRLGSPYSPSLFSRASYSPESSVCRDAKKRPSERWTVMASNGSCQKQKPVNRSSSTLGEMLALSETKKAAMPGETGNCNEKSKDLDYLLVDEQGTDEIMDNSPNNFMRSKSVPVSSTEFGSRHNVNMSLSDKGKPEASKEETNEQNAKTSFKRRVSSLFFLSSKKSSKDKSLASDVKDEFESSQGQTNSNLPETVGGKGLNHLSFGVLELSSKASFSNVIGKHGMTSLETGLSISKSIASGNPGENQDQPSPISVLDLHLEDNVYRATLLPQGVELSLNPLRSNLIDKSPPIGSIARTLQWDDSCLDTASSSYSINKSLATQVKEEEQEWYFFVKTLLSVAGLQGKVASNSFLSAWHSSESPLDPSLRDNYIDLKDQDTLHEAKRRQKRSTQKLVFDCVNAALVEIAEYESNLGQRAIPCTRPNTSPLANVLSTMLDEVWARMNGWGCGETICVSDDVVLEMMVRNEVVSGNRWIERLRLDMEKLRNGIEGELLEELVEETVAEMVGKT